MLKLAVDAQLPLVAVTTRDVINLPEVLKTLTGKTAGRYESQIPLEKSSLYYFVCPKGLPKEKVAVFDSLYEKLVTKESTLLIVNPPIVTDAMFSAGEVPVPRPLMLQFMATVTDDKNKAAELLLALGGVTIKEAAELAKLTMVRDSSLTAPGIVATRKQFFQPQAGMTFIDPHQDFYEPNEELKHWLAREKMFFLQEKDHRLIPRGLLFGGPPGTGKTAGAKYIAEQWGVPLYRIDVGATKTKWHGESEANWVANLNRLDNEQPCVALFDEIEKVFASGTGYGDSGTTTTMLSQLLWWLAERRTRVLAVMTTNDAKKLPKELYRERRVDRQMEFHGLDAKQGRKFAETLLAAFKVKLDEVGWMQRFAPLYASGTAKVAQAALTEAAYTHVKDTKIAQLTTN